ncbi:MAG: TonB-dependent receptor [Deltaproteobacteria bacterium]|nr:TonB-dependent receptor [Deltaproteobacteria bacterium]
MIRIHSRRGALLFSLAVAALLLAPPMLAQNPTGTLTGRVTDDSGGGLPGVTVTANSDKLQGTRVTVTGANGDYKLAFLPPGQYNVNYELDGFKSSVREVKISAAQTSLSDISMEIGVVTEEITVTGAQSEISETSTGATNVTQDELENLPIARNLTQAINLVPGVQNTGPSSAPSIAGAASNENLWMINGVVINENIRGSVLPLFIEDAIQETTTAVSGVSAEYGRFTGGVVNAITKSGGNEFDGSLRVSLTNEDWESATPLTSSQADDVNETYEGTLGGFLWKDHLWFFTAGRDRSLTGSNNTSITNIAFGTTDEETRLEGKLTVTPAVGHSLIGSYLEIDRTRGGTAFGTVLDLRSVNAAREDPQEIKSVNYTGILTPNFFVEGQWSNRDFVIARGSGGVPDIIDGTLIRTRGESFRYWAPTFCGSCEDEKRDNENILGKLSYFLTSEKAGSHDISFGYDTFDDNRFSINHQTGSDFTIYASDVVRDGGGNIALDAGTGSPFPILDPNNVLGDSSTPWVRWFAIFNEDLAQPTSFKTNSFYVNDRWQLNDKWSFNIGFRFDENDGADSSGATVAQDSKVSPRFGATYDLKGDGDIVFHASYGTYVAALANSVADNASNGGAVGQFRWDYDGPAINTDPNCAASGTCTSSPDALRIIFDWYESVGGVFDLSQQDGSAPLFNLLNSITVPGATLQIQESLDSPSADEISFGVTKRLGSKGMFRADVVFREWDDFYAQVTNLQTGTVPTNSGSADLTLQGNFANDVVSREYTGLHTQFRYRFTDRFTLAGNYTLSKAEGNFDGETPNSGPVTFAGLRYPEYRQASWHYPDGNIRVDSRHKFRIWGVYDILDTARHKLNVSLLQNFFAGQPYSANRNIDTRPFVDNPGYQTPPSASLYYFGGRGAFTTDDITRTDLSFNYSFNIGIGNREIELFLQPEVINIFNEDGVIDPQGLDDNEGINNLAPFDPFTETPVEGVNYELRDTFGQALNENDFQTPRTIRFSVGVRF